MNNLKRFNDFGETKSKEKEVVSVDERKRFSHSNIGSLNEKKKTEYGTVTISKKESDSGFKTLTSVKDDDSNEKSMKLLEEMKNTINDIFDKEYKASLKVEEKSKLYDKIDKLRDKKIKIGEGEILSVGLYDLEDYLKDKDKKMYNKFTKIFNNIHDSIRKEAKKLDSYNKNIWAIIHNTNVLLLDRKFQDFVDAYEKVLDHYKGRWAGYWSLISRKKNGEISGCYLGDTADREYFYTARVDLFGEAYKRTGYEEKDTEYKNTLTRDVDSNISLAKKDKDKGHIKYLEEYKKDNKLKITK